MLRSDEYPRNSRTAWSRMVALGLVLVVGWSSVEILWAEGEPTPAMEIAGAAADQASSEEDCPCLCACSCQPVHVVLAAPPEPGTGRATPEFETVPDVIAPMERSLDPLYPPPRLLA